MKIKLGLFALLFITSFANAADGTFDRSAEVDKYLPIVKDGARGVLLPLAKDVYVSGLSDPKLAAAFNERLMKDYKGLRETVREDTQYGAWLIKALASFGIDEYIGTLKEIKAHAPGNKLRSEADEELENFAWHRKKNEIMNSSRYFVAGDNPRTIQLLNLLKSDDFTYKHLAADRISWEKNFDPKLMEEVAVQIPKYANNADDRIQWKTMGLYCKLLGYSSQPKYRDVLHGVLESKANFVVKKHAKEALDRLK